MTYSQAEVQGQRSVGSDHRVETDRQTEAIALPPSLMQLVTSSSVIAEGPRDALSQLKSCQLLHAKFFSTLHVRPKLCLPVNKRKN